MEVIVGSLGYRFSLHGLLMQADEGYPCDVASHVWLQFFGVGESSQTKSLFGCMVVGSCVWFSKSVEVVSPCMARDKITLAWVMYRCKVTP